MNSRTHSERQIAQIAASIKEFGFLNPVIVDGENGIIAGHGRVMAAQKLGLDKIPVIEAKHLTDSQRRAYVIADNKLAMNADWNNDYLKIEIESLQDIDFDMEVLGFEEQELSALFLEKIDGENDADAEWTDMPEFDNPTNDCFKVITVRFDTPEDVAEFFSIIGQSYTDKTKSIWFPEKERRDIESERYL